MLLRHISSEAATFALRGELVESVNRHLSATVVALKSRPEGDSSDKGIDIEELSFLITGLKVLANSEFKDVITKDDIGVELRDPKAVFKLLDKVPDKAQGKLDRVEREVFKSLAALAPKMLTAEREELNKLLSKDSTHRKAALSRLSSLALKVETMYHAAHNNATKSAATAQKNIQQQGE